MPCGKVFSRFNLFFVVEFGWRDNLECAVGISGFRGFSGVNRFLLPPPDSIITSESFIMTEPRVNAFVWFG